MWTRFCLVVAVALAPRAAPAQTVSDGVQAVMRGDYTSAVQILRPLAEQGDHPDPIAQFFLGTLYQAGHGVARDEFRACSLYRSAAVPANPLRHQSEQLAAAIADPLAALPLPVCPPFAPGLWHAIPAVSFALGPDHSITIDANGATVRDNGAEHTTRMGALPGVRPLPARYSPVDVTHPVRARRHFIQQFHWWPPAQAASQTWTLAWMLSEVVGDRFLPITGERSLTTVAGSEPPASFDGEAFVTVRANENGEAEWAILTGPNARRAVIPPRVPQ